MRPILPQDASQGALTSISGEPPVKPNPIPAGNPSFIPRISVGAGATQNPVIGSGLVGTPSNAGALPVSSAQTVPNQQQKPIGPQAGARPVNPVMGPRK